MQKVHHYLLFSFVFIPHIYNIKMYIFNIFSPVADFELFFPLYCYHKLPRYDNVFPIHCIFCILGCFHLDELMYPRRRLTCINPPSISSQFWWNHYLRSTKNIVPPLDLLQTLITTNCSARLAISWHWSTEPLEGQVTSDNTNSLLQLHCGPFWIKNVTIFTFVIYSVNVCPFIGSQIFSPSLRIFLIGVHRKC